jgi:phosphohistidine phosphatase
MAAYIASIGLAPDLVLCSTACRTRETLARVQGALGGAAIRFEDMLYLAEPAALLALLRRMDPAIAHVMIIGHNPGLELLAQDLSTSGDPSARRAMATKFPTAALAVIDLDTERWSGAGSCRGTLRHFMSPKRLPGPGPSDVDD